MSRLRLNAPKFAWLLALTAALSACGGGGDKESSDSDRAWTNNPAGAASFNGAPAAYQGAISGLGSIVVNGVRFETTDAVVYDSDDFSTDYNSNTSTFNSPLALGMTVALFGDVDDAQSLGRAARIRVVGGVRGTMSAVDTTALTLSLPTQTVQLSAATSYGGTSDGTAAGAPITSLAQLATLNKPLLTLYGVPQADDRFLATRVVVTQASAHAMDVAVRGTLSAAPTTAGGNYSVKTDANTTLSVSCNPCVIQPSGHTPAVGDAVRVLASDISQWDGTTLKAARLQVLNAAYLTRFQGAPSAASYAKIKGVAQWDGNRWWVGGTPVNTTPASSTTLTAGRLYEVKGTWDGAVLMASRVEAEDQRSFTDSAGERQSYSHEFYGAVSGLSGSNFTVQGVAVNASAAYFPYGSGASLREGDFVEVKGRYANGTLQATKVEIKSASGSNASSGRVFEMYGQVSDWTGAGNVFRLTRLGTSYQAQTSANTQFKYGTPSNGSYVEAKGYMDSQQVFQIIKLELKNGYDDYDD